ncbi:hypothetical protein PF007_g9760, partial [Phytophthora fragariae]
RRHFETQATEAVMSYTGGAELHWRGGDTGWRRDTGGEALAGGKTLRRHWLAARHWRRDTGGETLSGGETLAARH